MKTFKEPLYRKVNTKARGCHHHKGVNYSYTRNSKTSDQKMKQGVQRGLDYTPLFKFLLSRVGQNFDEVYSEAVSRLDKKDPIFWMVTEDLTKKVENTEAYFRVENSFFNTLYVDASNLLQKVNPNLTVNNFEEHVSCACCTHTFNGKVISNKE